jgi:hypothetical protein
MSDASTTWKEQIPSDEEARFAAHAQRFTALQQRTAHDGRTGRALHLKAHGLFEARFEVLADLPARARHGLFAEPRSYDAVVRYSNGAAGVKPDSAGDVRGIAVKLLGVAGDKVLAPASTQDFLGILSPALPFRNADEFVAVVWAIRNPVLALFRLIAALGPVRPFQILRRVAAGRKDEHRSLATRVFYSGAPIQCGPFAARFSLVPRAAADAPLAVSPDMFATDLAARLRAGPVTYDFALQFFVDQATTPIEDPSVDWPTPYVTVARLVLAQQDASSERGKRLTAAGERLSFDPWHALVAHRPLGNIMRARKHAYYASTQGRAAAVEPADLAALLAE